MHEQLPFLESANGIPECVVHLLRDVRQQTLDRIRVARVTAEAKERTLFHLQEHTVAFRTRIIRRLTQL